MGLAEGLLTARSSAASLSGSRIPLEIFFIPPIQCQAPMGRTVPTWRDRFERRVEYWSSFRKTLRSEERAEFDRLLKSVRSRSSACGMLPASDELEPAMLAMLVELSSRISKLEGESRGDA